MHRVTRFNVLVSAMFLMLGWSCPVEAAGDAEIVAGLGDLVADVDYDDDRHVTGLYLWSDEFTEQVNLEPLR